MTWIQELKERKRIIRGKTDKLYPSVLGNAHINVSSTCDRQLKEQGLATAVIMRGTLELPSRSLAYR